MYLLFLIILLHDSKVIATFSPDTSDYNAYGPKIAANDVLFVEAYSNGKTFVVQFAPYNYTFDSLQCSINYDDTTHYVYSVGVGQKQTTTLKPYFYFAGEVVSDNSQGTDTSGNNGTFIGIWINQDSKTVQQYLLRRQSISCDYFEVDHLEFISSYEHQEFFVIAVEPYGQYAIGLATEFGFIYRPFSSTTMTTKVGIDIWPNNSTFNPCAADASETFTIVAGFIESSARSRVRATPTVYLIWNTNLTVLSTWSYSATNNSWQSRLTYSSVNTWSSQYTMSVKINSNDSTRVLIGMPFLNTVFLFVVSNNGTNLTLTSYFENGQSVGYGTSVSWLTSSQAAILVSTYSLNYLTWYSSKIYLYTSLNDTIVPSSPSAVIPNAQQPLPSTINSKLIRIVSTPASLAILDTEGGVVLILAEASGYYASTDISNSPVAAAMPVVSHSTKCIGGTYKSDTGIHPCILCPSGSRNPGIIASISCITCLSSSFCPLGAIYEMNSTLLTSVSQAYAYPRSPEMDVFEDILLNNMFSLGSTGHCLVVSPVFWTLILLAIFLILLLVMASLYWWFPPEKRDRLLTIIKNIFQRTDLVGEGELWIGGLASIAIVLITAMAYAFAILYMNQYPSEKVGASTFACDTTIRNAKFQTSLQALAVPVSDEEQPMFDLLNEQNFTLYLDFINTLSSCMSLSISEVTDSSTISMNLLSCSNLNGTLSATVFLPQHDIKVTATLNDIQLVGGIRVGLSGPSSISGSDILKELNFRQSFYSQSPRTFTQAAAIDIALTKVVNETEPLSGSDSEFGGIWYPTFTYSLNEMFITADTYAMSTNLTSTTLTIDISETSYYIKNVQSPIAKQPEIIFRTLLFSFLCLEICAMTFLICKLLLIPIYRKVTSCCFPHCINSVEPEYEMKSNHH
ncbi:unnamed protein product [Rotaria sordida]|uniref:Transmembrane protein n=2 Tax=Rotaria sordida TaxID=392033 RepID=A0A815JL09_9BILA|nr:unnamed protein product [Rotaria sordida]